MKVKDAQFFAVVSSFLNVYLDVYKRQLKDDVGHKGAVQEGFGFGPELVALLAVAFGVGDQGGDEVQHRCV